MNVHFGCLPKQAEGDLTSLKLNIFIQPTTNAKPNLFSYNFTTAHRDLNSGRIACFPISFTDRNLKDIQLKNPIQSPWHNWFSVSTHTSCLGFNFLGCQDSPY